MSLPSVMLFVPMKMSRGTTQPLHCTAFLADRGGGGGGGGSRSLLCHANGGFKGPLVKKARGPRCAPGARAEASRSGLRGLGAGVIFWFLILLIPVRRGSLETNPLPEVLRIQTLRLSNCII